LSVVGVKNKSMGNLKKTRYKLVRDLVSQVLTLILLNIDVKYLSENHE